MHVKNVKIVAAAKGLNELSKTRHKDLSKGVLWYGS